MTEILWPAELPQLLIAEGLTAKTKSSVIRTEMEAGPAKARRRYTVLTKEFNGKIICNEKQRIILENFYKYIISNGVLRFVMKDPQTLEIAEFRFLEDYEEATRDGFWEIKLKIEKMQ